MRRMIDCADGRCNSGPGSRPRHPIAMTTREETVHADSRALAALAHQLFAGLACPALAPFLAEWPQRLPSRARPASGLAVLRWLTVLAAEPGDGGSRDASAECCAALVLNLV